MARCGCSDGSSCSCLIRGSGGITVTGAGTATNPYLISGGLQLGVMDSQTINFGLTGDGSTNEPYILTGSATVALGDLIDVDAAGGSTGYVLAQQADGSFALVAPSTAPVGAINVGNGIDGDGSSGDPLRVKLAADSGLTLTANGLAIAGGTSWMDWTPVFHRTSGGTVNIGTSTLEGRYMQVGKLVAVNISLIVGSGFVAGSGAFMSSLPVPPAPHYQAVHGWMVDAGSGNPGAWYNQKIVMGKLEGDGFITRMYGQRGEGMARIGSAWPNWVPNTQLVISGTYEAA